MSSSENDPSSTKMEVEPTANTTPSASETTSVAVPSTGKEEEVEEQQLPPLENAEISPSSSTTSTEAEEAEEKEAVAEEEEEVDPMKIIAQAIQHKEEGNEFFKTGDLTKASRSYRKGTSILQKHIPNSSQEEQIKALLISLQTNLSMVSYKLDKFQQSRDVANKVLELDSSNIKALYRRALANKQMKNLSNARQDLKTALQLDPKNKAVQKELVLIKKEIEKQNSKEKLKYSKIFESSDSSFLYDDKEEEQKKKMLEKEKEEVEKQKLKEKRKQDWEDACVDRMSRGEEAITFEDYEKEIKKKEEAEEKEKQEQARKKAKIDQEQRDLQRRLAKQNLKESDGDDDSDGEELTERELQMLRGYKKTSDGRTTSYFTREQTEEEKKLLGSIAPKKLDTASSTLTSNIPNALSAGGVSAGSSDATHTAPQRLDSSISASSAWNQAGTWEEKDTSEWCNTTLKTFLKDSSASHTSSSTSTSSFYAKIKNVKDLNGDASVAFVSGKKRYVFDYNANIVYKIYLKNMSDENQGDDKDDDDVVIGEGTLFLPDISSTAINDELEIEIKGWKKVPDAMYRDDAINCRENLVGNVRQQVIAFVTTFNAQY